MQLLEAYSAVESAAQPHKQLKVRPFVFIYVSSSCSYGTSRVPACEQLLSCAALLAGCMRRDAALPYGVVSMQAVIAERAVPHRHRTCPDASRCQDSPAQPGGQFLLELCACMLRSTAFCIRVSQSSCGENIFDGEQNGYRRFCSAWMPIFLPLKRPMDTLRQFPTGPRCSALWPQQRWRAPSSKQLCLMCRRSLHQSMSACSQWKTGLLPWRRQSHLSCSGHRLPKHQGPLKDTTQVGLSVTSASPAHAHACTIGVSPTVWHVQVRLNGMTCVQLVTIFQHSVVQGWA